MYKFHYKKAIRLPMDEELVKRLLDDFNPEKASALVDDGTGTPDKENRVLNGFEVDTGFDTKSRKSLFYIDYVLDSEVKLKGKTFSSSRLLTEEETIRYQVEFDALKERVGFEYDVNDLRFVEYEYFYDGVNVPNVYRTTIDSKHTV